MSSVRKDLRHHIKKISQAQEDKCHICSIWTLAG